MLESLFGLIKLYINKRAEINLVHKKKVHQLILVNVMVIKIIKLFLKKLNRITIGDYRAENLSEIIVKIILKYSNKNQSIKIMDYGSGFQPKVIYYVYKKLKNKHNKNIKIHCFDIYNSKKLNIKVKMCFILGLPGEPRNILEKTINFLEETKPDYASVSGFLPVPGSPIFQDYRKYGIVHIDRDWNKYSHLLYRFSDEEETGLPFEYEKTTPWGESFTRDEIKKNIIDLQKWLEERRMVY